MHMMKRQIVWGILWSGWWDLHCFAFPWGCWWCSCSTAVSLGSFFWYYAWSPVTICSAVMTESTRQRRGKTEKIFMQTLYSLEKNVSISSSWMFASNSVSLPRLDTHGVCPTSRRQWADFLVSLMAPLHRQYKTARTETRRHLLLKIGQMPTQTSASRGYVLFDNRWHLYHLLSGAARDTHKSPKIVCWLADTVRGVLQTWKDTDHRRCKHSVG